LRYGQDVPAQLALRERCTKLVQKKNGTGLAGAALYRVESHMKNTFPTLYPACIRARRGERLACFRTMAGLVISPCSGGNSRRSHLTVTNLNDSGAGSLRDSIASASAGDQIQFQGRGERRFVYADEQHLIGQFGRYLP
jgi:hypothetical protein